MDSFSDYFFYKKNKPKYITLSNSVPSARVYIYFVSSWLNNKLLLLLHVFRYRNRTVSQHINITRHLIVVPAVDYRLGNGDPDRGLGQIR